MTQETVDIRCGHGDMSQYPLVKVRISIGQHTIVVRAAVSSSLPVPVLLGRDVPQLRRLLAEGQPAELGEPTRMVAVTTRWQARREEEQLGAGFHEDLFRAGRNWPRLTRREKRAQKQRWRQDNPPNPLGISREQLREMQKTDNTLKPVWSEVSIGSSTSFFHKDGILYRKGKGRTPSGEEVEHLVFPARLRRTALELAHSIPLAGHLGKRKTGQRLLQRFYWPTLFKDIDIFCRGCPECQKVSLWYRGVAALVPLAIVDVPFEKIAMDIVGPLPRSQNGNRYILVVCDYATRWPEVMPLKSIDAEHVAEELMALFSRVGVPREILTDQGTNFTLNLLAEIYRLLHIKPIRTSHYDPQTDGLVKRFNQTLKAMLRKAATEEGKDLDKLVPYVLFAYREVPQASTGFSPFELVYGRAVRGPLDVLKESWEVGSKSSESVISYILSVQERLEKMAELASENLGKAQKVQKKWYDQNARQREFMVGDNVLVLLPTVSNKMLAKWQDLIQSFARSDQSPMRSTCLTMLGRKGLFM